METSKRFVKAKVWDQGMQLGYSAVALSVTDSPNRKGRIRGVKWRICETQECVRRGAIDPVIFRTNPEYLAVAPGACQAYGRDRVRFLGGYFPASGGLAPA